MPYCNRCGAHNPDSSLFCSTCGASIPPTQPSQPSTGVPSVNQPSLQGTTGGNTEVSWICDREQCRYSTGAVPPKVSQNGLTLFGLLFIALLGLGLTITIFGAILGVPMMVIAIMYMWRRSCPACRRGGMVSIHSKRGNALWERRRSEGMYR